MSDRSKSPSVEEGIGRSGKIRGRHALTLFLAVTNLGYDKEGKQRGPSEENRYERETANRKIHDGARGQTRHGRPDLPPRNLGRRPELRATHYCFLRAGRRCPRTHRRHTKEEVRLGCERGAAPPRGSIVRKRGKKVVNRAHHYTPGTGCWGV